MPVNPNNWDDIVARINKKYENDIRLGNDFQKVSRIPTGSLELDAAMGGGVPIGRWTRFYGGYSSTKSTRALSVVREAQKMGLLCAYYNLEKQYDPVFTKNSIGVDVDNLTVVEGTSIEEVGDKMEALFQVVHLHVIDSCSIAVSEDELDADIREWRPGITSRAWGKVFRRLNERFDQNENTVIMIDQVRTNFKTGAEEAPGGRILDHQSSMTIHFKKGAWLHRAEDGFLDDRARQARGASGQMEPAGIEVRARVMKSRVCRPFRTATMRFDFKSLGFDNEFEVIKAAKYYGIVDVRGRFIYYTPPQGGEAIRFDNRVDFRNFVRSDISFQEEVRDRVMRSLDR
jgi:recombination protein RecA